MLVLSVVQKWSRGFDATFHSAGDNACGRFAESDVACEREVQTEIHQPSRAADQPSFTAGMSNLLKA
jgi:hypothetical protein